MCSHARSPKSTSADACDDAAVSSPGLDPSHPSPSRPSSRLGSSEQDVDAATSASYLLEPGNPTHQNSTVRSPLNRAPVDFGGQPSQPVTPISAVPSNPVAMLSSHNSVGQLDIQLAPPPSDDTHSVQAQQYLAPPPSLYVLATHSQQSFHSETTIPPAGRDSPPLRQQKGMFSNSHNFSMTKPTFVDGNIYVTNNIDTISSQFMEKLLEKTIPGAASDSSARYPPPQCYPGTRLTVLERCLYFIANCDGEQKIRWVVGAAGVGKSAIMQSVADFPNLPVACHVSVFFSINGRNDGTKAIITLSYQFAAKSALYRQLIESKIERDPSLLQSSMPVQFEKFIVEPFIHNHQLISAGRVLIIIDGLDECNNPRTQQELLRLISDFCITYPSSPIVWLIASRPERHITSFFSRPNVMPAYEKEEILVDSDEAREDVELFLREELEGIKEGSPDLFDPQSEWPREWDLWKLANAAGGLFAYADTAIKYIGDLTVGNPVSQLSSVLNVIDNHPMTAISREEHPMALLDALYARILYKADNVMVNTRKVLLALVPHTHVNMGLYGPGNFVVMCNWLGMTCDEAYAAINHLNSTCRVPSRDNALREKVTPFHKSFIDYISDFNRSGFSRDIEHEAQQLRTQCAFRILNEAADGVDSDDVESRTFDGTTRRGPGTGDNISLTWRVYEEFGRNNKKTRLNLYRRAIDEVIAGMERGDLAFQTTFCIRLLTTRFEKYDNYEVPFHELRHLVFDKSRRQEFITQGILKQIPLNAINVSTVFDKVALRFCCSAETTKAVSTSTRIRNAAKSLFSRPPTTATDLPCPWSPSCEHERKGEWERQQDQEWQTTFGLYQRFGLSGGCAFCSERLSRLLQSKKAHSPGHMVPILFTFAGACCVELLFVDPDDRRSEWTYWLWFELSPEEREKYGGSV